MRNFYFACLTLITLTTTAQAQQPPPSIEWQKCLGGTGDDRAAAVIRTADNGLLIAGSTKSNDGDVTGNHGTNTTDAWVVKLSASGSLQWQHTFGGSGDDNFSSVIMTGDGNYVCLGVTTSNDGDVSGNHGNGDIWVVKIDPSGNLVWQKCLGGSSGESAGNIRQFSDGKLVVIGTTTSNDGDVSGLHIDGNIYPDMWVARLDANGNFLSQKCFGGKWEDRGHDIVESANGDIIVSGIVNSDYGDFGVGSGGVPVGMVARINASNIVTSANRSSYMYNTNLARKGNMVMITRDLRCYPGNVINSVSVGSMADSIMPGSPGYAVGYSANLCNVSVISSTVGFRVEGPGSSAFINSGNNVTAGTNSNPTNLPGFHGGIDGFLVNYGSSMNWQKFVGGNGYDVFISIIALNEFEFIAVGYTDSNDGDVSGNHGNNDMWVVKLSKSNIIKGSVFYDYNSNGVKDATEPFVNNVQVTSSKPGQSVTSTTNGGLFYHMVDTGTYTTTIVSPDTNYIPFPASINSTFSTWNNRDSISFGLQAKPVLVRDYKIRITSIFPLNPNADMLYRAEFTNVGTDTLINKNVGFVKDPRFVLISSTPAPTTIKGDTLLWAIDTLLPRDTGDVLLKFYVPGPPTLNKGDRIEGFTFIDSTGDASPANNKWSVATNIIFDPYPYTAPPQPAISGLQNEYCSNQGLKQIKITNLPDTLRATKASVTLDGTKLPLAADTTFSFTVSALAAGQHTIQVVYSNPSYTKTGTFTFAVITSCSNDQTIFVDIDNPRQVINVYPNPVISQLTINGLSAAKQYIITLTDLHGRPLYTKKISNQSAAALRAIPGAKGVYWLNVYDATRNRQIGSMQLIKQ